MKSLSGLTDFREKTEVIVVSDCSPGPAEEICQKFSSRLNLRYHQHKRNLSVFQARKSGIDLARGRYILSLDSDDYLIEMRWGDLIRHLDEHDVDILRFSIATEKDKVSSLDRNVIFHEKVWDYFVSSQLWQLAGTIVKKNLFSYFFSSLSPLKARCYINMADDLCMSVGIFNNAKTLELNNNFGSYFYRLNYSSLTTSNYGENKERAKKIGNDYLACRIVSLHYLKDDERKKDFQRLLDSNIKWVVPRIYHLLPGDQALWKIYTQAFSEDLFFFALINEDVTVAAKVLTSFVVEQKKRKIIKNAVVIIDSQADKNDLSRFSSQENNGPMQLVLKVCQEIYNYEVNQDFGVRFVVNGDCSSFELLETLKKKRIDTIFFNSSYSSKTLANILFFKYLGFNIFVEDAESFLRPFFDGHFAFMRKRVQVYKACDLLICREKETFQLWSGLRIPCVAIFHLDNFRTRSCEIEKRPEAEQDVIFSIKDNSFLSLNSSNSFVSVSFEDPQEKLEKFSQLLQCVIDHSCVERISALDNQEKQAAHFDFSTKNQKARKVLKDYLLIDKELQEEMRTYFIGNVFLQEKIKEGILKDAELQKKIRRYDKMERIFDRIFPRNSVRRMVFKGFIFRFGRLFKNFSLP